MHSVLIPVADGVEEMELAITFDTLRRAQWQVVIAGIKPGVITASRGLKLMPDKSWAEIDVLSFGLLVLPGGKAGTDALAGDPRVLEAIRIFSETGKIVAAICAAPLVLQAAGVLHGRRVTCNPAVAGELTQAQRLDERVVIDGNIITSQGPGTAFEFALAIVREAEGATKALQLAKSMLVNCWQA